MNNEVITFIEKFKSIINEKRKFLYYTIGTEFQLTSIKDLDELMKDLVILKEKMIDIQNEESANTMLCLECILSAYINEFRMLILLKGDKTDKAWEALVQAQMSLMDSLKASDFADNFDVENHLQKLLLIEKLFFPPQTFNSFEGLASSSTCSICNQKYGTCNHLKGKPYMGKLCHEIIKLKEIKGASIVDIPGNKMCRVHAFLDKEGWRDVLTWRITKN